MPLYKTMVLSLLEDRPQLHEQLRQARTLLATLNRLADELKLSHEAMEQSTSLTGSTRNRSAAKLLEMALNELEGSLPERVAADEDGIPPRRGNGVYLSRCL